MLLFGVTFHVSPSRAVQDEDFKDSVTAGRRAFNSNCAGCHGLDGRGNDKGADIAASNEARRLSDARLSATISNGIPGTGMPAFHGLSEPQVRLIASYVRVLQGKLQARTLPGDATRGKAIFFGKGKCSSCHAVSGEGGFLASDLSAYGSTLPAVAIRNEIVKPDRTDPSGYRSAVLTTRDGDRLEGVIRNEDNFSVQLQTKDGNFHFFQKSDLRSVEHGEPSFMPADYRDRITAAELDDLVSYLMNVTSAPGGARSLPKPKDPIE
jgi:cytochrome c oxidase cbb3-type subunit III